MYFKGVRQNILTLVKQGFTREEVYFMPIGEMLDYIKILLENAKEVQNTVSDTTPEELSTIGTTLPGMF